MRGLARFLLLVEYGGSLETLAARPRRDEGSGIRIRRADRDDILALTALWSGESYAARIEGGDVGVVAELGGNLVGTAWIARRTLVLHGRGLRVAPQGGEGYLYGIRVLAPARRRGIGAELVLTAASQAVAAGLITFRAHVSARNRKGRRLQHRLGARPHALWIGASWGSAQPFAVRIPCR